MVMSSLSGVTTTRHLRDSCVIVQMQLQMTILSLLQFISSNMQSEIDHVQDAMSPGHTYKIQVVAHAEVERFDEDDQQHHGKSWYVSTHAMIVVNSLNQFLKDGASELDEKLAKYSRLSSGWTIKTIKQVFLVPNRYEQLIHLWADLLFLLLYTSRQKNVP